MSYNTQSPPPPQYNQQTKYKPTQYSQYSHNNNQANSNVRYGNTINPAVQPLRAIQYQKTFFQRFADVGQRVATTALIGLTLWSGYKFFEGYTIIHERNQAFERDNPELAEQIRTKLKAEADEKKARRG